MIAARNGLERPDLPLTDPYSPRTPIEVVQAGDVIDPLQAKSVFLDLRTRIARPAPGALSMAEPALLPGNRFRAYRGAG
ncbi:hypothetical protein ACN9MF_24320 [Methylobacterium fujisawaense]|uniref:hypothetical protein n=1 Tax=Methylobacterium fujisawaense TaxID=107400 RepID=UPI0031F4FC24